MAEVSRQSEMRKVLTNMRTNLLLIMLVGIAGKTGCARRYTETVVLDHAVMVTDDWLTLKFPQPLKAQYEWDQELLASVSSRYEKSTQGIWMRMPDGTDIWPDVQIENESGEWLPLKWKGFYGNELSFSDRALLGNGKNYVAVRLRITQPITISRLVWNSYDPREVKR